MRVRDVGQAGLVGLPGRVGRRVADAIGRRTPLDADTIASAIGLYLIVSSLRRLLKVLRRLRGAL